MWSLWLLYMDVGCKGQDWTQKTHYTVTLVQVRVDEGLNEGICG